MRAHRRSTSGTSASGARRSRRSQTLPPHPPAQRGSAEARSQPQRDAARPPAFASAVSRIALCLAFVATVPAGASADVIGAGWPPAPECEPVSCIAGTQQIAPAPGHSRCSPGCGPTDECERDEDCLEDYGAEATCGPTRLCVGFAEYFAQRPVVHGVCGADDSCAQGECQEARRCVAPPEPPPAPATSEPVPMTERTERSDPVAQARAASRDDHPSRDDGFCSAASGSNLGWLLLALAVLVLRRLRASTHES